MKPIGAARTGLVDQPQVWKRVLSNRAPFINLSQPFISETGTIPSILSHTMVPLSHRIVKDEQLWKIPAFSRAASRTPARPVPTVMRWGAVPAGEAREIVGIGGVRAVQTRPMRFKHLDNESPEGRLAGYKSIRHALSQQE